MKERNILWYLAAMLFGAFIMTFFCEPKHKDPASGGEASVQVDSVKTQIDTSMAVAPDPSEIRHDTIYIRVVPKLPKSEPKLPESVPELPENVPEIADSVLYLPVLLEQKVYEDSTYRAVVSGPSIEQYGPRLDSISIYSRKTTVYQTKTVYVEPSPWSFGVTAGVTVTGKGVEPGITAGVTYTIWRPKKHKR